MRSMCPRAITNAIVERLDAGELTRQQAEQLLGFVLIEASRPTVEAAYATFYRRCSALRSMGLLADAKLTEPVPVAWGSETV